jgi:hypothetical protein
VLVRVRPGAPKNSITYENIVGARHALPPAMEPPWNHRGHFRQLGGIDGTAPAISLDVGVKQVRACRAGAPLVHDLWTHRWPRKATGDVIFIRYTDDTIAGFQRERRKLSCTTLGENA